MIMFKYLVTVFILCLTVFKISCFCPESHLIKPCVCEDNGIYCGGSWDLNLTQIFDNLQNNLNNSDKHFKQFHLNSSYNIRLSELKDNTFRDITFDNITVTGCRFLTKINKNAFNGTDQVTKYLDISNNERLKSEDKNFKQDNSIYRILTKFMNAQSITFGNNAYIDTIPDYAFSRSSGYQDKLKYLKLFAFRGNLGKNAFSDLRNLETLIISDVMISGIQDNSFEFYESSNTTLTIKLCSGSIYGYSFTNLSLANIRRPTHLIFACPPYASLKYLEEKVFYPFLEANPDNKIDMNNTQFFCQDCKNYWLYKRPELSSRLENLKCGINKTIDDPDNFHYCEAEKFLDNCELDEFKQEIACENDKPIDLKAILGNFSNALTHTRKVFNSFKLWNTAIEELQDNTFHDLKFYRVEIAYCKNLKTINKHAFNGTDLFTRSLIINRNPKLESPDNSIYEALGGFKRATDIDLSDNNITDIPTRAFKQINGEQNNLFRLTLEGPYKKLASYAFANLKTVMIITFTGAEFDKIEDYGFAFDDPSNNSLSLDFRQSMRINSSVFSENSLLNISRPATIYFGDYRSPKQISYLDEKVFLPFLLENERNFINLLYQEFNCTDCRNYWLTKHRDVISRLHDLGCSDNKSLFDPNNFKNCH